MKPVYISSASAISPQDSFDSDVFLSGIQSSNNGKLFAREPDYRQYINPVAIRRMSRLIKMGIACGMNALQKAGVQMPDAIITGTGLGSMTDTEKFLKDMISLNEEALNPTYFIQSTYNSVNGWISLQTKCSGYNQTYVNRGFSLEMALTDAQLFLNESENEKYVLAGSFDELTDEYFLVKSKADYWKKQLPDSLNLLNNNDSSGTIGGEGAAFFVLSNNVDNALCQLKGIQMLHEPSAEKIKNELTKLLEINSTAINEIDVVICGKNGDARFEPLYAGLEHFFTGTTSFAAFKHLTGEYPTSSGFAVWMATQLFAYQKVPDSVLTKGALHRPIRNILVINHYLLNTASIILFARVRDSETS